MEIKAPSDSNFKVFNIFKWKNKVMSNDSVYNCMFQRILKENTLSQLIFFLQLCSDIIHIPLQLACLNAQSP